jgi:hypothetical protein
MHDAIHPATRDRGADSVAGEPGIDVVMKGKLRQRRDDAPPDPRGTPAETDADADASGPRSRGARVEIVVPIRTLIVIAGVAALAALVIALQGALLSIVVAAVLSLGLDPLVGALVARGWPR